MLILWDSFICDNYNKPVEGMICGNAIANKTVEMKDKTFKLVMSVCLRIQYILGTPLCCLTSKKYLYLFCFESFFHETLILSFNYLHNKEVEFFWNPSFVISKISSFKVKKAFFFSSARAVFILA